MWGIITECRGLWGECMIYVNRFGILKIVDEIDHDAADSEGMMELLN